MFLLVVCDVLEFVVETCGETSVGEGLLIPSGESLLVEGILEVLKLQGISTKSIEDKRSLL